MKLYEITKKEEFLVSCIYCWTNLINGKKYVGQTQNFYNRMKHYTSGKFNPHMGNAIEKYGLENFEIEILEKNLPLDQLDQREQYWMDFYQSYKQDKGYNIAPIAGSCRGIKWTNEQKMVYKERLKKNGHPWTGRKHTDEWKVEMSKRSIAFWETHPHPYKGKKRPEHSEKLKEYYKTHDAWNKGIPQTEEQKRLNSIANSGEKNAMYGVHLCGEKNGMYGKHHTNKSKELIRQKALERDFHPSPEHMEKLSKRVICVETGITYPSASEAARQIGVSPARMSEVCRNPETKCKGKHFRYIE